MEKPDPVLEEVKRNLGDFMKKRGGDSYVKSGLSKKELGRGEVCIYVFTPGFQWQHDYSVHVYNIAHLVIQTLWFESFADGTLRVFVAIDPALEKARTNGTNQRKRVKPED